MYINIYLYVYIYICICVFIYSYIHTHTHTHTYEYIDIPKGHWQKQGVEQAPATCVCLLSCTPID